MTDFLLTYGLFLAKVVTLVVSLLILLAGIIAIISKGKIKDKERFEITKLNTKYKSMREAINDQTLDKYALKKLLKKEKYEEKLKHKEEKTGLKTPRRIFVLDFNGDIKASAVDSLREEVTLILTAATPKDEVIVKIESPGGMIHSYGLAASQLRRIRDRNIPLIAAVDKVAASGGYMMACVADRIIAAPFAIIGSIGVLAQLPNFYRLLKKHDIDFEQIMGGQYKRTLSLFGENTAEGRKKMQQEVDTAHELFKKFVFDNRTIVDIEALATGEAWYGSRALELRLIDEIKTSDDYLLNLSNKANIYEVKCILRKGLLEKLGGSIQNKIEKASWAGF